MTAIAILCLSRFSLGSTSRNTTISAINSATAPAVRLLLLNCKNASLSQRIASNQLVSFTSESLLILSLNIKTD